MNKLVMIGLVIMPLLVVSVSPAAVVLPARYDCNVMPAGAVPPWTTVGSRFTLGTEGAITYLETYGLGGSTSYFYYGNGIDTDFVGSRIRVDARVKVLESSGTTNYNLQGMLFQFNGYRHSIYWSSLLNDVHFQNGQAYVVDLTQWNTFAMEVNEVSPSKCTYFVNGIKVGDYSGSYNVAYLDKFFCGDLRSSGGDSKARWDYALVTPVGCGSWGYDDADLNHDCYVDFKDLALIAQQWLKCTDPNSFECD